MTMKKKDDIVCESGHNTNEDLSSLGRFRREQQEREDQAHARTVAAEVRLLGEVDQAEYDRRRGALRYLVADPSVPLEEATLPDYEKRRQFERRQAVPTLRVGDLSMDDYREARDKGF